LEYYLDRWAGGRIVQQWVVVAFSKMCVGRMALLWPSRKSPGERGKQ